jgi:hypothetical protein
MTKRVVVAGLLGGIAMYVWSVIAHVVLPLGQVGIKQVPNETPVLAALTASVGNSHGLYLFPRLEPGSSMQQYQQKLDSSPSGLIVYHEPGRQAMSAGQLITDFITEVIEALLAAFLVAQTRLSTFAGRVGFIAVVGVLANIATNIPYWNWYGFPGTYTASYVFMGVVGFIVAGLVIAAMLGRGDAARVATA